MNDWKWASVRGWPERMMAAKSHSINSVICQPEVIYTTIRKVVPS
jgi:hypothetical protein